MHDETAQERFARCWSEAMFGYAHAASAAAWIMTNRTLAFWGEATRSMAEAARPPRPETSAESWFRPGPVRNALLPQPATPQTWAFPRFDPASLGHASPFTPAAFPSPFAFWFSMFPLKGPPASWPMAFGLIASGVPQAIAWPTAQANMSMLDAADAAKTAVDTMLATCSSGNANGHRYEPELRRRRRLS